MKASDEFMLDKSKAMNPSNEDRELVTDEMVEVAWKVLDDSLNGKLNGQEYAYGDEVPMRAALAKVRYENR